MNPPATRLGKLALLVTCLLPAPTAPADPVLPGNVLDPQSAAEAWNVIRLSTGNVERLIREKRLDEVPVQISFSSPALRALSRHTGTPEAAASVRERAVSAVTSVIAIARAGQERNEPSAAEALKALRGQLSDIAQHFDPKTVGADIFFCPMHPDFVSELAITPCGKCGMKLLPRRIPYSFIYTTPGEPTVHMTASASGPIVAGRKTEVRVRLSNGGGAPVLLEDLMVMHTQPIHLLIEEPGLGDYHHEHPMTTATPGEYAFSFTPARSSLYRIWADLVPAATGLQELPFADLPSEGKPGSIADRTPTFSSTVDGFTFVLTLANGSAAPLLANQTRSMHITVTDRDGKPVTRLEPAMNAFAHLVGFYEDFRTVVHLHPTGGDILNPEFRGGPSMGFKFYPPKAGFMRLYCQVSVDGKMLFAPFNVDVRPQP